MNFINFLENENDYPGRSSLTLFTAGCNFNCGYCHNPELKGFKEGKISEEDVWSYIIPRKDWLKSIVISGGEPTLQNDLPEFAKSAKENGLSVKLDTNGSNPSMLKRLLEEKLIDYVAMDVKAPASLYSKVIGDNFNFYNAAKESMRLAAKFPDYEFRTTVAPVLINGSLKFMNSEDIFNLAREIHEITWNENHKYFLQPFMAVKKEGGNKMYLKENLPKEMLETPKDLMESCKEQAKLWLPKTEIRN